MLRLLLYFALRPDTRLPQDDQTGSTLKVEAPSVTPESRFQLVLVSPDSRHDGDDGQTSSTRPVPNEERRDNDQEQKAAQHTIHADSDEESKGSSEAPQSEENKERSMHREDESTTEHRSSAGESSGSGAKLLPPDEIMEEQAEIEEMKMRELYLMSKERQRRCETSTINAKSQKKELLKEDFKDSTPVEGRGKFKESTDCLLYTSPSPRDA